MMWGQARASSGVMGVDIHMILGVSACPTFARTDPGLPIQTIPHYAEALGDGCSNGPTEAVNLLIKKVKRVGHGFRNFTNYRLRLLLYCGVAWQTHQTAKLRGRSPCFVA